MLNLSRREALLLLGGAAASAPRGFSLDDEIWPHPYDKVALLERPRILRAAQGFLEEQPRTIVSVPAPRSAGGSHDYFSEGDYWWPNPKNPDGPYIELDGQSNPANFNAHRELLIRMSIQMPGLTAAWVLTKQRIYAEKAAAHLRSWFVDPQTRMNPNLQYAQTVHGLNTGRSTGIIDTVHFAEVARAAWSLDRSGVLAHADSEGTRGWFTEYLQWLTSSEPGQKERDNKNNHESCWVLQVASFASFVGDSKLQEFCRARMKDRIFSIQIAPDGSFPLELARTKPYGYCLFDLDILGMCAQVLSGTADNLWNARLPDGRGLESCFRFMTPFVANKQSWSYRHDVQYFDDLPVRQPSLLFAGLAYRRREYLDLWQRLNPDPTVPEVIRNHPVRQPILWMTEGSHATA